MSLQRSGQNHEAATRASSRNLQCPLVEPKHHGSLYYLERRWPFGCAQLSDEEVELDFAREAGGRDEVVVIATSPLTKNERWTAFGQGELLVFEQGRRLAI